MSLLRCVALMLLLLMPLPADAGPHVGRPAPPLAFEKLFNAPPTQNTSLKALEGKLVVVDFWATWCGTCIVKFPHIRKLAAELKDEPVAFLFVSVDDTPEIVEDFLSKNELPGWVGVDSLKSVAYAYGVRGYPTAARGEQHGVTATTERRRIDIIRFRPRTP